LRWRRRPWRCESRRQGDPGLAGFRGDGYFFRAREWNVAVCVLGQCPWNLGYMSLKPLTIRPNINEDRE
jgi:hypothetical protein